MTFTNGGGFVQAQTVVQADEFVSTNFSNTNETGFDLNSGSTTDSFGTPANTIQIYSGFQVGPTTGSHLTLAYDGTQAKLDLFSGDAAETTNAAIYVDDSTAGRPTVVMQGATLNNGRAVFDIEPATTTDVARASLLTTGETTPSGWAIKGLFNPGGSTTDTWTVNVSNTNVVNSRYPGLVIGDNITPGNRMLISSNEIAVENGSATSQTLYLNDSTDSSYLGSVVNRQLRAATAASGSAAAQNITSTSYAALPSTQATSVNITCPASGVATVSFTVQVAQQAAAVVGDFAAFSVNVTNTTHSTTPFAAADTRSAVWTVIIAGAAGGNLTLSRTLTLSGLGVAGDSLTVAIFGRISVASHLFVERTELSVVPSL